MTSLAAFEELREKNREPRDVPVDHANVDLSRSCNRSPNAQSFCTEHEQYRNVHPHQGVDQALLRVSPLSGAAYNSQFDY